MRKCILTILVLFIFGSAFSQKVYWATELLDFSSELSPYEYSAEQVLGKPNALPEGGDNPNAWMPAKPNRLEYISVGFEKAIRVEQIIVAESYNPSAVYQVFLYDEQGNQHLVHTFNPKPIDLKGRLFSIFIDKTDFKVDALRLIVDGTKVPGYSGIDAIGVSSSKKPIKVEIEQPKYLNEEIITEKLGEGVNSAYEESRPLIAPDGKTLFFSRANHPGNVGGEKDDNDIWSSEFDEESQTWKEATNVGAPLNNKGPNFISSITPDGNTMTVLLGNQYKGRDKMKPGISFSTKTSEGWSKPKNVNIINAYIESTDGDYYLANNRQVLLMAIGRYDAYGGKDIYVSFMQKNGKWTEPLNLGNDINTAHMESSPYLAADNETLYFSSKGYSGYGESDVYISRRLDDTWTNWTEPENLGPDINSAGEDVFFNIPPSGKYAYYSKSVNGKQDIYRLEMPVFYQPAPVVSVSGKVVDSLTNEPVLAKIDYRIYPEQTNIGFTNSDSLTGEYEMLLPVGSAYEFKTEAEGYLTEMEVIDLAEETDFMEITRDIYMNSGVQEPTVLAKVDSADEVKIQQFVNKDTETLRIDNNVLFEFASDYVNEEAHPYLDKIAEYLKNSPDERMLIIGHTDNVGSKEYNIGLSRRRANSVLEYFLGKGLPRTQFETKGYGFDKPIMSNDTEEGRSQNRRVEFSFIEKEETTTE